jgi:hypothetical protein
MAPYPRAADNLVQPLSKHNNTRRSPHVQAGRSRPERPALGTGMWCPDGEVSRVDSVRRPPEPPTDPEVRSTKLMSSHRLDPSRRCRQSGLRRFSSWSSCAASVIKWGQQGRPLCVNSEAPLSPPRPISRARLLVPRWFWVTLTIESRERILGTLSRIVAQQLALPSGVQEANDKRS